MSTPRHIVRAALEAVERAISLVDAQGKAVFVFDSSPTKLDALVMSRQALFDLLVSSGRSAEEIDAARGVPSCKILVAWDIGEHAACVAYEPAWSVS